MKHLKFLQLAFPLFLLLVVGMRGQETSRTPLLVGPTAGFAYGADKGDIPVWNGSPGCGLFERGRSFIPSFGGTFNAPSLFSPGFGLLASARLSFSSGRLSAAPLNEIWILDAETRLPVFIEEEYRLNLSAVVASVDLLASVGLTDRIALSFGPFFGYRFSSTFSQTENLSDQAGYRFPDGTTEREMPGGSNPEGSGLAFGPALSATLGLPLGEKTWLVPGLSLRADLLSSVQGYSQHSYQAGVTLSLLFDVTSDPSPPPPSAPPQEVLPHTPVLTASVGMYGIDGENSSAPSARIEVYETFFQQHAPLLPAIFFEQNRADFPERYIVTDPDGTADLSVDDLAGTDVLPMQRHALNIVGLRMRQRSGAFLTVTGSVAADEDPLLARARAETVRSYLVDVWGIAPDRVRTGDGNGAIQRSSEETEDGRNDNRRVEMASGDSMILASVVTSQMIREFDPPLVRIVPEFQAEAGIREWSIVVSQGGREAARYGGRGGDTLQRIDTQWRIDYTRIDSSLSPLTATLRVEDSTGAVAVAEAVLPMTMQHTHRVVDRRVEQSGDRERLASVLVGFRFGSAELGAENRRELKDVADAVREGARITLTGYTDRIGEEGRNRELAGRRAANAAAELGKMLKERGVEGVTVNVSAEGVETERFDNDLPEGRFLSRGVGIIVEQKNGEPSPP